MSDAPDRDDGLVESLLAHCAACGTAEAEVFRKRGRGRRVWFEPAILPGGRPRLIVSASEEDGVALRLRDRRGRWGFAWRSPLAPGAARSLVAETLAVCRPAPADGGSGAGWSVPCAARSEAAWIEDAGLAIDDPDTLESPVERLADLLAEASEAASSAASGAAEVDRALLAAARATVTLATSNGFRASYRKSLALLSVTMAPAAAGARPALEERSACAFRDIDPRECGREAAWRSLPARPSVPAPGADLPIILAPRAAASFLSSLSPWLLGDVPDAGGLAPAGSGRSSRLSIVDDARRRGGFGSAPFDGAGRPTRRTTLLSGGLAAGRLSATGGHLVRASFREAPAVGFTNLSIVPASEVGELMADPLLDPIGERLADQIEETSAPCLRVGAARFIAGPRWRIRVLRGEWRHGGAAAGPADGLAWEGPLQAILDGVTAAGSDVRFVHLGLPVGAPSLRLEGLRPWVVEGTRDRGRIALNAPARHPPARTPPAGGEGSA